MSLYWLSINLRGIQDICQGTLDFGTYDSVAMSYYCIPAVVQLVLRVCQNTGYVHIDNRSTCTTVNLEIFVVKISS